MVKRGRRSVMSRPPRRSIWWMTAFGEASGIVLDEDGAFALVELETADAVDLADAGDAEGGGLGRSGARNGKQH